MTDVLTRQIYGRLFRGTLETEANTGPWGLLGAIFDRTNMPALVLEPGKQIYHSFTLAQAASATLALPQNYSSANRLYIAVRCNLKARLTYTSPTHGSGRIVILNATDSDDDGLHAGFWTYQGDITSFAVSIPSTADGGATTDVQVFMYEIPDVAVFESYYDKQIGLGTTVSEDD